jgi:hypothetical protein
MRLVFFGEEVFHEPVELRVLRNEDMFQTSIEVFLSELFNPLCAWIGGLAELVGFHGVCLVVGASGALIKTRV